MTSCWSRSKKTSKVATLSTGQAFSDLQARPSLPAPPLTAKQKSQGKLLKKLGDEVKRADEYKSYDAVREPKATCAPDSLYASAVPSTVNSIIAKEVASKNNLNTNQDELEIEPATNRANTASPGTTP